MKCKAATTRGNVLTLRLMSLTVGIGIHDID
jgi:hypothetical protein